MYNKKESVEDYLEKILMLKKQTDFVRAIDLAKYMNFSKASVSVALKKLKEQSLVSIKEDGNIELTIKGEEIAKNTLEKHHLLKELFISLDIDESTAEEDACKIEHLLSEETYNKIKNKLK